MCIYQKHINCANNMTTKRKKKPIALDYNFYFQRKVETKRKLNETKWEKKNEIGAPIRFNVTVYFVKKASCTFMIVVNVNYI